MEVINKYVVGERGGHIVILRPPEVPISKEDALLLAAWIIVTVGEHNKEIGEVLEAVKSI